jgi:ASPIC and UnbV/FG-GAP-like repeat
LEGITGGLNLIQADYDNDGDLDVLVLRGAWLENHGRHPKSLLRNDGKGVFTDVTYAVGLGDALYPTQTAGWADYDHDGDLDLYVGNEAFPCHLFKNDDGKFHDLAAEAGVLNGGPTKAVAWGDYDNDSWPDLYVSNLGGANLLYRNQRDGTFVNVAKELGVEGPNFSFPIWFWDANNDGRLDLYVASYKPGVEHVAGDYLGLPESTEPDAFYFGTADGKFEDRRQAMGFTRVTQPMGVNVGDIDNDGFLDFYLGTGYVDYEGLIPNLLFHNQRGEKFVDITFSARVGHLQKGHGIAFADFDSDGDLDIFAVMGGWFSGDAFARAVFANPGTQGNWLVIKLSGKNSNSYGVGTRIKATVTDKHGKSTDIYRWMDSGGSFGANPLRAHFGLAESTSVDELEVFWPASGIRQNFKNIEANRFIEIREDSHEYKVLPYSAKLEGK